MVGLDSGYVDQLDVVADFDTDSVAHLGDDFIWALVLRVERRLTASILTYTHRRSGTCGDSNGPTGGRTGRPDFSWQKALRRSWPLYSSASRMNPGSMQLMPYIIWAGERSSSSHGVLRSPKSTQGRLSTQSPPWAASASFRRRYARSTNPLDCG